MNWQNHHWRKSPIIVSACLMAEIVCSFNKPNSGELIEEEIVRHQMDLKPELLTSKHAREWPKASRICAEKFEWDVSLFGGCPRMVQVYCRVIHGSLFLDPIWLVETLTRPDPTQPAIADKKSDPTQPAARPFPHMYIFNWINIYLSFNYYILNIVEN